MRPHLREIKSFLNAHGATHVRLTVMGSGHARFLFDWKGEEQYFVCSKTPSDNRGILPKCIAELRRQLGEPIAPSKTKRTLDDLMAEIKVNNVNGVSSMATLPNMEAKPFNPPKISTKKPEEHAIGKMAVYAKNMPGKPELKSAKFIIPIVLYKAIGSPPRMSAMRDTKNRDSWNLYPVVDTTGAREYGSKIAPYSKGFVCIDTFLNDPKETADIDPFGASPADYIADLVERTLLATVDVKHLKAVTKRKPPTIKKRKAHGPLPPRHEPYEPVIPEPVKVEPLLYEEEPVKEEPVVIVKPVPVVVSPMPTKEEIRRAIDIIKKAESLMPLKLIRSKTRGLVFEYDSGDDC